MSSCKRAMRSSVSTPSYLLSRDFNLVGLLLCLLPDEPAHVLYLALHLIRVWECRM